jgi:hypothetical protein
MIPSTMTSSAVSRQNGLVAGLRGLSLLCAAGKVVADTTLEVRLFPRKPFSVESTVYTERLNSRYKKLANEFKPKARPTAPSS